MTEGARGVVFGSSLGDWLVGMTPWRGVFFWRMIIYNNNNNNQNNKKTRSIVALIVVVRESSERERVRRME